MSRLISHLFKVLATIFGIIALLVMIAAWRLAYVPIHSTGLTPYVSRFLAHLMPDVSPEMASSTLDWDNHKQTLTLTIDDLAMKDPSGNKIASFKTATLKARLWHVLRGGILPEEFFAQQARIWLVRDKNGVFSFGSPKVAKENRDGEPLDGVDLSFLQFISDEIANPRLRQLISIKDTVFSVRDESLGHNVTMIVPEISLDHDKTAAKGQARIELNEMEHTSTLQINYDFDFASKLHHVALNFQDIKPSVFAAEGLNLAALKIADIPLSGQVSVDTDRNLNIAKAYVNLLGGKGTVTDSSLWDKPCSIESLIVQADYNKAKDKLTVDKAEINFGGPRLAMTLEAKMPPPKDVLWLARKSNNNSFTLTIALDDLPMDRFGEIWPKVAVPDARNWIVNSMSKGIFTHGDETIRGKFNPHDLANVVLESGTGKVYAKDGLINYLSGMPAVENASAEATFDLDHMDVKVLTGHTGAVKIRPFTLVMDKFQEDVQYIVIPLSLTGPVKDVLKVLDSPILGYATAIGLSPDDSSGQAEGILTLRMPLLDALLLKDVDVKAQAKITDFGSKKLVSGIELSQGNLDLDLTKDGFALKGAVGMNGVPSQLVWKTNFGEDRAKTNKPIHEGTVTAILKGEQWGQFYGLDSLAKVQGHTPVSIKYTNFKKGVSKVEGQVILGQAAVQLRDIGWKKPNGMAAQVGFVLDLNEGKNLRFKSIDLQGQGVKVKGTAELDHSTGKLVALNFKPFVLGRSNATVSYSRPVDTHLPLSIAIDGESFDMNGIDEKNTDGEKDTSNNNDVKNPESSRPKEYSLQLVKLYTSDDGFISSLKGRALRDEIGWKSIDLWGVAQGVTPLSIKLLPEGDRLKFNLSADNFGNALQGMGLGSGVKSGKIEIVGESTDADPRTILGKLKIDSFIVTDLPVLARLLSAVSPFGFMDMITGDAGFDHLNGRYKWHGSDVDLSEVRAAGSVVGINLNGRMNLETGKSNLNGTLVPFSFVNNIIGSIPLLGDVITGGSGGGIIAASFSVTGKLSDPNISVNPVSLLTPGILRSIFFSNDDSAPDMSQPKEQTKPTAPKPQEMKSQSNISKNHRPKN